MKSKKIISIVLLIFVLISIGFLITNEVSQRSSKKEITVEGSQKSETQLKQGITSSPSIQKNNLQSDERKAVVKEKIVVYYFHATHRCPTCLKLERYSKEAIEKYFAEEVKNGILEFKPVNVEEPENRHYIQDYQLYTKSLIITSDGKWKNLTEIWHYVRDKENFFKYVKEEVEKFLHETK